MTTILIAMWLTATPIRADGSRNQQRSTAIAMQEFSSHQACVSAQARIGVQPGLILFCVPK